MTRSPGGRLRSTRQSVHPEPPTIWLVRHGETEWSRLGRHTGRTDVELTVAGRREARRLGARLRPVEFDHVLSSPAIRAVQTAQLAGFADAERVADLREWDYGEYEGLTTARIRTTRPGWTVWADGVPSGETAADVGERADRIIERVLAMGGRSLLIAHAHILRVLTARWLELPPSEGRLFVLATGTISVLGWEREQRALIRWNAGGEDVG